MQKRLCGYSEKEISKVSKQFLIFANENRNWQRNWCLTNVSIGFGILMFPKFLWGTFWEQLTH